MLYVRMTDKFMSGWGAAQNATNVLVIACDTAEQAYAIKKAAEDRSEMRRVSVSLTKPRNRPGVVLSLRHVSELGGSWLKYLPAESAAA